MENEKKTVIIIHGISAQRNRYEKIMKILSDEYTVIYFEYDWRNSLENEINKLKILISKMGITSAHFITHSFGSIIFKLFYEKPNCETERLVQLAPLNNGSILLNRMYWIRAIGKRLFGIGPLEFIDNQAEIISMPLPKETGVIAGDNNFIPDPKQRFVAKALMNISNSDGKIHIDETQFPKMKDFYLVHECHSFLMMNDYVIKQIEEFLSNGIFNKNL